MPTFAIYDWSLFTTSLTDSELRTSTHGNDTGQTGSNPYNPSLPTWTGIDFTYDGGGPTVVDVSDDDGTFEDGYVETGADQVLASDVTINGKTYLAGRRVELEFSLLDADGNEVYVVRIDGENVGFAYAVGSKPTAGETYNFNDTRDGLAADSLDQSTASLTPYPTVLCYAAGTEIATALGEVAIERLVPGDLVWTADHGPQPVRWVRQRTYIWSGDDDPKKPVLIRAGALGAGLPRRDLVVSANHRMLMPGRCGLGVLMPAKAMTDLPGIRRMRGLRQIELVHLMFDRHEVIRAEGAPSESFFPGPAALSGLSTRERLQAGQIAPDAGRFRLARRCLTVRDARARLATNPLWWTDETLAAAGLTGLPAQESTIAA